FCWGLSACVHETEEGGEGYRVYGAPPPADAVHDGTVAPYAAAASVIFAPEHAIPTLRYMYQFKDELYKSYGFLDAFNITSVSQGDYVEDQPFRKVETGDYKGWFSLQYLGIDQGITVLMIENYRSAFVYNQFMSIPEIKNAMEDVGFSNTDVNFMSQGGDETGSDYTYEPPSWIEGYNVSVSMTDGIFHNEGADKEPVDPDTGMTYLGNRALKVEWGEKFLGLINVMYDFHHDDEAAPPGRAGNYMDLTLDGKNTLTLWVKSDTDNDFPIRGTIYWDEPGVDDNTGEPLEGDEGEGEMLGTETYTGNGDWQKLSWYYGDVPEADDIKVVYIYPHANEPDDGGSLYMDNLNVETLAPPDGFPWLPIFIIWFDDLIEELLARELEIKDIITILTGVGAAHYLIKFLKDHLAGMKAFTQIAKDWRVYVNQWMVDNPKTTFFGLLWVTRGIFALESALLMQTAFLGDAPLTAQSIRSLGFGLGTFAFLNLTFANLSRLMISQFLDKLLLERNIAYEDYSAGIPDSQRMLVSFPG
ncbi:MAG: hypothetical protein KAQ99_10765, partial [Candidatus Aureabacteria bacterium]|nr:hypothetical protein [Candidatus Auribacterota bacterium]